jgi:hypothetical protein
MPTTHMRPCLHASVDETGGTALERRLRRYSPRAREPVRALANRHPRIADLAASFPALLFALAMPRRGSDPEEAIACVIRGCSLAEVADAAGVPLWLRKLPTDGLVWPLPQLPDGELFRRRIANHLPRSPKLVPAWLASVADAAFWAHEPLAIWIARELTRDARAVPIPWPWSIVLWAWFSMQPGTCGHRLIDKPWHPAMRFKAARDSAEDWRMKVALHVNLGEAPIADMWLQPGRVDGFDFVPLDRTERIAEEAAAMENCLCRYGYNLSHNRSRLWSVRKDGQRVATLKVARWRAEPLLAIYELQLARNKPASTDVWWAAMRWLYGHDLPRIDTQERSWGTAPLDAAAWRGLWRPYWLAKRRIPSWLPLAPSRQALEAL